MQEVMSGVLFLIFRVEHRIYYHVFHMCHGQKMDDAPLSGDYHQSIKFRIYIPMTKEFRMWDNHKPCIIMYIYIYIIYIHIYIYHIYIYISIIYIYISYIIYLSIPIYLSILVGAPGPQCGGVRALRGLCGALRRRAVGHDGVRCALVMWRRRWLKHWGKCGETYGNLDFQHEKWDIFQQKQGLKHKKNGDWTNTTCKLINRKWDSNDKIRVWLREKWRFQH
jgi:hypothetical protein